MKELIILRGLPGSGKSTVAKLFGTRAICTADDYITDRKGNYNWRPETIGPSHKWCQRKCKRFLERNIEKVVVANTNIVERDLNVYFRMGMEHGYRVHSIVVENRHGGSSIHDVPEETMKKFKDNFSIKL